MAKTVFCYICGRSADEVEKLFHFPTNPNRCQLWLEKLGLSKRTTMSTYYKICDMHFSTESFIPRKAPLTLKRDAVPNVWRTSAGPNVVDKVDAVPNIWRTSVGLKVVDKVDAVPNVYHSSVGLNEVDTVDDSIFRPLEGPSTFRYVTINKFIGRHQVSTDIKMGWKPCSVPDCNAREGIRFRFPHPINGRQRFAKWLEILKNPQLDSLTPLAIYNLKRLCAKHFEPEYLLKPNKLKYSAIPTLFVPDPGAAKNWNYSESTDYFQTKRARLPHDVGLNNDYNQSSSADNRESSPESTVEDVTDTRCRVCLKNTENGVPLNYTTNIHGGESLTLLEIIKKFCNVQISLDDEKPQSICVDCAENARAVYEFRICCEKTDSILHKEIIEKLDSDTIEENKLARRQKPPDTVTKKLPTRQKQSTGKSNKTQRDKATNVRLCQVKYNVRLLKNCQQCSLSKLAERVGTKRKRTAICLRCYKIFKKQVKFKLYDGLLIRKKRYRCSECGARFADPKRLRLHRITHKNVLLYELLSKNGGKTRLKLQKK